MNFYKARAVAYGSLIIWDLVASSTQEYESLNYDSDPLVRAENNIPATQFGVSPLKIVNGQLVNRTQPEMSVFEASFIYKEKLRSLDTDFKNLETETFTYDGVSFPMTQGAKTYYEAITIERGTTYRVLTSNGSFYNLNQADIDAFYRTFCSRIISLLNQDK